MGTNAVTQVRTIETDGYEAEQIGYGEMNYRQYKYSSGHFAKAGVTPRRHLTEVRTSDASSYELGQELKADTFKVGAAVDVIRPRARYSRCYERHGFAGVSAFMVSPPKSPQAGFNWCLRNSRTRFQSLCYRS